MGKGKRRKLVKYKWGCRVLPEEQRPKEKIKRWRHRTAAQFAEAKALIQGPLKACVVPINDYSEPAPPDKAKLSTLTIKRPSWRKTFIYALRHPKTHHVAYVGKSNYPELRYRQHIHQGRPKVKAWVAALKKKGLDPELFILQECSIDIWKERERHWIALFRENLELLNVTDGGDQS